MASVLAIVSKAVFDPLAKAAGGAQPGTTLAIDRYSSTHKSLSTLADGGALFLVTVRPPDEQLWLVAILASPALAKDGWHADVNTTPIANITALVSKLKFSTGNGITAKPGALAMSLQTPRTLTDEDVQLLRAAAGSKGQKKSAAEKPAKKSVAEKPAKSASSTKAAAFDLGAIADALEDDDASAALESALIAWRGTRAASLADLIDAISSKIDAPEIDGDTQWSAMARAKDASDLGALLAAIPTLPASFLPSAGDALNSFAEDPRIAMAVATWTLDPVTTSSSTHPFWTRSFEAMIRAADARVVPVLKKRLKMPKGKSQFWPKLYGAIERAIPKIEKAPRSAVDDKAIAKLVKAAEKLAATKPAKKAAKKPEAPKLAGAPLAQAIEHLDAGRVQAAIDAMLDAWRTHERAPAIADAIDRATKLLPAWDRPFDGTDKEVAAAWHDAFDADPQAAMPQLLDHLATSGPAIAEKQLAALAGLPDDPRIGLRLAELAARHPVSPERTQFWKALLELVARIRDPRTAPALCAAFRNFEGNYYNHHRQARRIIGAWAQNPPVPPQLGPKETAALDTIGKRLSKLETKSDRTEHDLIKAICDAWTDDGPRLVYADWLAEREHPRGEVIVLACKAERSDAENKRLTDVLRKPLYGPLEEVAHRWAFDRNLKLDRGLPTRIPIGWDTSALIWRKLVGYPLLATIEAIDIDIDESQLPPPEELARVMRDPTARRLSKITNVPKDYGRGLAAAVGSGWRANGKDYVRS